MGRWTKVVAGALTAVAAGPCLASGAASAQTPATDAPVAELLTPAEGESGELLNPTFTWTSRWGPSRADELELRRVEGDRVVPVLRITQARFELLAPSLRTQFGFTTGEDRTRYVATAGRGSLQLREGIPPGTYEWAVTSGWWEGASAPRRFTVAPQPLDRLVVRPAHSRGDTEYEPGILYLEAGATPYAEFEFTVRHGDTEETERFLDNRDVGTLFFVYETCRRPGGTLRWSLVARDALGNERSRSGTIANVTRARCETLRTRDELRRKAEARRKRAEARRRADRERRRREAERRQREEDAAARRDQVARFRRMCESLAGRLVIYVSADSNSYRCHLPNGDHIDL